jgi:hypothetical protein
MDVGEFGSVGSSEKKTIFQRVFGKMFKFQWANQASRFNKQNLIWLGKATSASVFLGYTISTFCLTEENLKPVYAKTFQVASLLSKKAKDMGFELPFELAHAFSTADHGLHAAHYPWDFHKFWVSYDHAAYIYFFNGCIDFEEDSKYTRKFVQLVIQWITFIIEI